MDDLSRPRTLIAMDIRKSSAGGHARHGRLIRGLQRANDRVCARFQTPGNPWPRRPSGDGELITVPGDVPKARILADAVREWCIELRAFNEDKSEDGEIRLRVAVEHGDITVDPDSGFPLGGDALVTVNRLCESAPLRAALDRFPAAPLALVVSDRLFHDVVVYRERGLDPGAFEPVRVRHDHKGFNEIAWLHVPGVSVAELAAAGLDTGPATGPDTGEEIGDPGTGQPAAATDASGGARQRSGRASAGGARYQRNEGPNHGQATYGDHSIAAGTVYFGQAPSSHYHAPIHVGGNASATFGPASTVRRGDGRDHRHETGSGD
ncbi:hypothetical protein [Gandjariella thermophila]|uniref:Uncharacterized protein n=1 Tax=Gandjariella thermophila TaxID=1931992 RepID=A0A4D4JF62_9PSEU|nr:hypothetical protein [Gandjariella thermophila]GDY32547.1 hypothetical protein GTS_41800 [Gandjariella thermophila]